MNWAAISGYLAGTMISPSIWGMAIVIVCSTKAWPGWARWATSTIAATIVPMILYALEQNMPAGPTVVFTLCAAAIWSLIFVVGDRVIFGKRDVITGSPTSSDHNP